MSDETTKTQQPELPMPEPGQSVPYQRFSEVTEARRQAEAQIEELRSQVAEMAPVRQQIEDLSAALQAERVERQTVEVLAQHGIGDRELRELVRWSYDRLPAENRPAFADAVATWKANPDNAPLALRPHLQNAPPAMPTSDRGTMPAPAVNGTPDPLSMTSDMDKWRAHREAILSDLKW